MYSLLLCIVKISLFGVFTTISLNTYKRREKAYVCVNYSMNHLNAGVVPGMFRRGGGVTLLTRWLKYGFLGSINAKNFRKKSLFTFQRGTGMLRRGL